MIMNHQPCGDSHSSYNARYIDLVDLDYWHASDERHPGESDFGSCGGGGKKYSVD